MTKELVQLHLRGIFYVLVSLNILENLQERYKSLSKALVMARRCGVIPVDWIIDESREIINIDDQYLKPSEQITHLVELLDGLPDDYVNSIPRWHNQPKYVEIWIEKNAIAGVFSSILTESRQVRIVPNGGWSSFSFKSKNFKRLRYYQSMSNEVYVLYYGDYDPSGARIVKNLALKRMGINFVHVAITKEQIERFGLQGLTNPDSAVMTKLEKDPIAESFRLENNGRLFQIELDALSTLKPIELRSLLEKSVDEHFDEDLYLSVISDLTFSETYLETSPLLCISDAFVVFSSIPSQTYPVKLTLVLFQDQLYLHGIPFPKLLYFNAHLRTRVCFSLRSSQT